MVFITHACIGEIKIGEVQMYKKGKIMKKNDLLKRIRCIFAIDNIIVC